MLPGSRDAAVSIPGGLSNRPAAAIMAGPKAERRHPQGLHGRSRQVAPHRIVRQRRPRPQPGHLRAAQALTRTLLERRGGTARPLGAQTPERRAGRNYAPFSIFALTLGEG